MDWNGNVQACKLKGCVGGASLLRSGQVQWLQSIHPRQHFNINRKCGSPSAALQLPSLKVIHQLCFEFRRTDRAGSSPNIYTLVGKVALPSRPLLIFLLAPLTLHFSPDRIEAAFGPHTHTMMMWKSPLLLLLLLLQLRTRTLGTTIICCCFEHRAGSVGVLR